MFNSHRWSKQALSMTLLSVLTTSSLAFFKPTTARAFTPGLSQNSSSQNSSIQNPSSQPSANQTPSIQNPTSQNPTSQNTLSQNQPGVFSGQSSITLPKGTVLPVSYEKADKIVQAPGETLPITLTLASNVRTASGQILIPAGSEIEGELKPIGEGTQFVATTLIPKGSKDRYVLSATSEVITEKETIRKGKDADDILTGAAIGAVAAVVISEVAGDIDILEVLGGAGLGALGGFILGDRKKVDVFVINPEEDLSLTLNAALPIPTTK